MECDGAQLTFRAPSQSELREALERRGELGELGAAIELAGNMCESGDFEAFADADSMSFLTEGGVFPSLVALAQERAQHEMEIAKRRWKMGERNPGVLAENLLAFKAYEGGGDPTAREFAGALAVADWLGSTKGIFQLFLAFMKALSKRRR